MFKRKGIMIDCSRNAVRTPETVMRFADMMKKLGYNTLMLYTEDTYEIESEPYFGYLRGRYTKEELKRIDDYCDSLGIELIPCIQTLAHLNATMSWGRFQRVRDTGDILMVGLDETYELIDKMLKTVSENFKSRTVHIGMDEAFMLGRGRYLNENGFHDRAEIMREHLKRVAEIADKYGLTPIMWGDMFNPEIESGKKREDYLPANVTPVYWDYYSLDKAHYDKKMADYKAFAPDFWFAGGFWSWAGFAPHNYYAIEATKAAVESAKEYGTENLFFTVWGDNGAETPLFSILPAMYYTSRLLDGETDDDKIRAGFYDLTGIAFDDFMLLDLPDTNFAGENIIDPEKYMLYNDPFMGKFDTTAVPGRSAVYASMAERLGKLSDNPDFGYMFSTLSALCSVLELKYDLGVRTKEAYTAGKDLKELAGVYGEVIRRLRDFYEKFRAQWHRENKTFGFEVQTARIGGLIQRLTDCQNDMLMNRAYSSSSLSALETELLDPFCREGAPVSDVCFNSYSATFSAVL